MHVRSFLPPRLLRHSARDKKSTSGTWQRENGPKLSALSGINQQKIQYDAIITGLLAFHAEQKKEH